MGKGTNNYKLKFFFLLNISISKSIVISHNSGRNVDNVASGGSSPSREVQEILSLQENESGDDELLEDTDNTANVDNQTRTKEIDKTG